MRAAARFVAELGRALVEPPRFTRALRDWAGEGPRRAYAEEVAAIYRAYRDGLEAAGLVDAETFASGALRALAAAPAERGGAAAAWGGTPVFVYGFDDFDRLQLEALETLANRCDADVAVSLPYERGRLAFKAVSGLHQELLALGAEELELPPLDDHYADESRAALHHLERHLFEDAPGGRVAAGGAVSFHSAGGERAEVELAAARVLQLLRDGVTPGDMAVVFRDPMRYSSLLEQVFGAYGIPYSIDRRLRFGHTGLGRGLLALIRAAGPAGTAEDLLAYLRTPGLLRVPGFADSLEAEVRREGAHRAGGGARALGARPLAARRAGPPGAARATTEAFVAELESRLERMFAAPYERSATVLSGPQLEEARALSAAQRALAELRSVLGDRPADPRARAARAGAARGARGRDAAAGPRPGRHAGGDQGAPLRSRVLLRPPGGRVSARRVARSRSSRTTTGARSPPRAGSCSPCARTGSTASATCSTSARRGPSALLVLSSRSSDEEGNPQTESYFVDDVRVLLEEGAELRTRSLSEVTWRPEDAPTSAEWDRAHAATGPRRPLAAAHAAQLRAAARRALRARRRGRPRARELRGLPGQVARGGHPEAGRAGAGPRGDGARLVRPRGAPPHLRAAPRGDRQPARDPRQPSPMPSASCWRSCASGAPPSSSRRSRRACAPRRAGSSSTCSASCARRPTRTRASSRVELERGFGLEGSEPVELDGGLRVRGRIDRVDEHDGMALVIDYKTGKRVDRYKVASWEPENRFQAALYMLVVEKLLGLRAAGGVYVALGSDDPRPRGMVARDVDELGGRWYSNDLLDPDEFQEKLDWALERIRETDRLMRAGELCARPDRCDWNGGCKYPSVCRSER